MKAKLTPILLACASVAMAQNPNPIRVNQVGYLPADSKTAAIEEVGWAKRYTLIDDATGKKVWKGKAVRTAESEWSGKKRAIVDFSTVTVPGTYTLTNGKDQQKVVIADNAYRDLSIAAIKSYYLQRTGTEILEQYAGKYARPAAHMDNMVMVHPSAASASRPAGTIIDSHGGWYDAGDYNKYIVNSAFTVAIMLDSYEMNEAYFKSLDLNIPESVNQIPDILDEIKYNIDWMLTMQDPEDGGVYHKLTTPNFEGFVMPKDCHQQRYVVEKTTAAALDFAATMAKMYRIYSKYPEFKQWAEGALEQAKKAYEWAERNPRVYYLQDEMNKMFKPAVTTGAYDDNHLDDEFLWAELELFFSTGDTGYVQSLADDYESLQFNIPSWGGVAGLAFYSAANIVNKGNIPYAYEIKNFLKTYICGYADKCLASMPTSCYDSPYGNAASDFAWGCMGEQCCGKGLAMLYAHALTGDAKYLNGARRCADYLLGRNATGFCYVTGFGTFSPKHPHQRLSEADGIEEPLPGFLVGGPNAGQQDKATCKAYPSDYPDESYADDMNSYASNEIAINWNASLVAFIGWLDGVSSTPTLPEGKGRK